MTARRVEQESCFELVSNLVPAGSLKDLVEWGRATLEEMPSEQRAEARFALFGTFGGPGAVPRLSVTWHRPETAAEVSARRDALAIRLQQIQEEIAEIDARGIVTEGEDA